MNQEAQQDKKLNRNDQNILLTYQKRPSKKNDLLFNTIVIIMGVVIVFGLFLLAKQNFVSSNWQDQQYTQMLDKIIAEQQSIQNQNQEIIQWQQNLKERENTLQESLKELSKTEQQTQDNTIPNVDQGEKLIAFPIDTISDDIWDLPDDLALTGNDSTFRNLQPDWNVEKPTIDSRQFKYFQLDNQLKVLLIQDSEIGLAQAALSVQAGSWQEPKEYGGLAHFLEHMLFQGSQTYPEPGYFDRLISSGGGSTNAYTQGDETNYYFSIDNDKLEDALNVFSHFFVDPLLSKEMVNKEANAVDSEYEIDVNGDGWKLMHLLTLMSDKDHPFSQFTIGNIHSLLQYDIVEQLKQFHQNYYSSNLMSLVIKTSKSLDVVEEFVRKGEFLKIKNKNLQKPKFDNFPIKNDQLGSIIKYRVNQHAQTVLFVYQLDDIDKYYDTKPLEFIDSIVRSKNKNGLSNYLIQKGLILDLDASEFLQGNGAFSFYLIQVILPDQNQDVIQIASFIDSYFDQMLDQFFVPVGQNVQASPYLNDLYAQKQTLAELQFKYMSTEDDVFKLAHNLNNYPSERVFSADYLYRQYDPEVIYDYLVDLSNPGNMAILIGSDSFEFNGVESDEDQEQNAEASFLSYYDESIFVFSQMESDQEFLKSKTVSQRSRLYKLDYEIKRMEEQTMNEITSSLNTKTIKFLNIEGQDHPQVQLDLPKINEYLPKNLQMKSLCNDIYQADSFIQHIYSTKQDCLRNEKKYEEENKFPQLVKKDIKGKSWWKLDRSYQVPQIFGGIQFDTVINMKTLRSDMLLKVFNAYIEDKLEEKLEESYEVGFELSFDSSIRGLSFELYGWSDNFDNFYKQVLQTIKEKEIDDSRLQKIKQNIELGLKNTFEKRLYLQAVQVYLPYLMISNTHTVNAQLNELNKISLEDISKFQDEFLSNFRYTTYFSGNVMRNEADRMVHNIHTLFEETTSNIEYTNNYYQVLSLQHNFVTVAYKAQSSDNTDQNSVTLNYYQIGHRDEHSYSIMKLIQSKLSNEAFNFLRTDLQLGYVVQAKFYSVGCLDGAVILVQGTSKPPYEVNRQIEKFLKQFDQLLKDMSEDEFNDMKQAVIMKLKEKPTSLKEESQYTWDHIKYNDLSFEEKEIGASMISQLEQEEVIKFFKKAFTNGKVSVQLYGKGMIQDKELKSELENKMLKADETLSQKAETLLLGASELEKHCRRVYHCSSRISNI